jgi:DNA-binding HxlR family transcriptional regulator
MLAGASTLSTLTFPLNVKFLTRLAEAPHSSTELLESVGSSSRTTGLKRLGELQRIGAVKRTRRHEFPRRVIFEQTLIGGELLSLAQNVELWLDQAPGGNLLFGSPIANRVTQTLVEGWNSTIVTSLACGPASLTELDRRVTPVSYPALERRLRAMRATGLVTTATGAGRGTPYVATDWLKRAGVLLLTAAALEGSSGAETELHTDDLRAALLLAVSGTRIDPDRHGVVALAVAPGPRAGEGNGTPRASGATIVVKSGQVRGAVARIHGSASTWALGTPASWLTAVSQGDMTQLRFGGRSPRLATEVVQALHDRLEHA